MLGWLEVKVLGMSKFAVLVALCAVYGVAEATIGSGLDDDNFRMLKGEEVENGLPDSDNNAKGLLGAGEKFLVVKRSVR